VKETTARTRSLYDEYRFGDFSYGSKREAYESLLFELLAKAAPGTELFDVGCGKGYWLDAYMRAGIQKDRITCVDLAPANVEELRQRGFRAEVGNVLELEFPDHASDLTVSIGVIHHTHDPFKAFRELVRITKPGGVIYLNVYNKLHPYYYVVHKATFPLRWLYWNWSGKVADVAYWFAKFAFQPLAWLVFGKFLDEKTGKTMFMDQVITPHAHLFTQGMLRSYAVECGCTIEGCRYNRYYLMLSAAIRVGGARNGAD